MIPSILTLVRLLLLTAAWCALWGEISIANLFSGFVISVIVNTSGNKLLPNESVNLFEMFRFLRLVFIDLIVSTFEVTKTIFISNKRNDEAIIAVKLLPENQSHLYIIVLVVTLTPGTAVVDLDSQGSTIYLHLLDKSQVQSVKDHVYDLADTARKAFPDSRESVKEVAA